MASKADKEKRNVSCSNLEEGNNSPDRKGSVGETDNEKYTKRDEAAWRNWKLLFCFVGLQMSYVSWGLVQEILMTHNYINGKFRSSAFCVFSNRFLALFISLAVVLFKRMTSSKPVKDAPFYCYAPSSISNSLSSWAQYEALKYISFPTQVLSKSCKIIPVMLVSNYYRHSVIGLVLYSSCKHKLFNNRDYSLPYALYLLPQ